MAQYAADRELVPDDGAPLLMGIDVARFGSDSSVFPVSQGRDARTIKPMRFKGLDTMALANEAATAIERLKPDAVFVDGGGVGGGVVDRLKMLGYRVIEVQSRRPATRRYLNRRIEMWDAMRGVVGLWLYRQGREPHRRPDGSGVRCSPQRVS